MYNIPCAVGCTPPVQAANYQKHHLGCCTTTRQGLLPTTDFAFMQATRIAFDNKWPKCHEHTTRSGNSYINVAGQYKKGWISHRASPTYCEGCDNVWV